VDGAWQIDGCSGMSASVNRETALQSAKTPQAGGGGAAGLGVVLALNSII
jgi:hypothetical protein